MIPEITINTRPIIAHVKVPCAFLILMGSPADVIHIYPPKTMKMIQRMPAIGDNLSKTISNVENNCSKRGGSSSPAANTAVLSSIKIQKGTNNEPIIPLFFIYFTPKICLSMNCTIFGDINTTIRPSIEKMSDFDAFDILS